MSTDWSTLEDGIRVLLSEGKRSQHPEFQALIKVFGLDRVTEIAKRILDKEKNGGES